MLANSKDDCWQHVCVLGICCPLGSAYFISFCIYISVLFPKGKKSPTRRDQAAELSLGRGDLQFLFGEQVQSQQGLVLLRGMSSLQWSGGHGWYSFSRSCENLGDPACFALHFIFWMKSRSTSSRHFHWDGSS